MISPSLSGICVIASRRPFRWIYERLNHARVSFVRGSVSLSSRRSPRVTFAVATAWSARLVALPLRVARSLRLNSVLKLYIPFSQTKKMVTEKWLSQSSQSCEIGRCGESVPICALPAMIARLYPTCVSLPVWAIDFFTEWVKNLMPAMAKWCWNGKSHCSMVSALLSGLL